MGDRGVIVGWSNGVGIALSGLSGVDRGDVSIRKGSWDRMLAELVTQWFQPSIKLGACCVAQGTTSGGRVIRGPFQKGTACK